MYTVISIVSSCKVTPKHRASHFTLPAALWGRYFYYFYFTDDIAQVAYGHRAAKWKKVELTILFLYDCFGISSRKGQGPLSSGLKTTWAPHWRSHTQRDTGNRQLLVDEQRRGNLKQGEQKEGSGVLEMAFGRTGSLSLVSDPQTRCWQKLSLRGGRSHGAPARNQRI